MEQIKLTLLNYQHFQQKNGTEGLKNLAFKTEVAKKVPISSDVVNEKSAISRI